MRETKGGELVDVRGNDGRRSIRSRGKLGWLRGRMEEKQGKWEK